MTTDVVKRTPQQQLVDRIREDDFQRELSVALPEDIPVQRFTRAAATALLTNPDLATKADHASIFLSLIRSAQDGLMPDGREAALVIYGQKAQYLPMIQGYRKIAGEHGITLRTAVVYANDLFDYTLGLEPTLLHVPVKPGEERGEMVAAYAVAVHRDGRKEFLVMDSKEINKIRNVSRASKAGPWVDWPERMWEKTVGRRLFAKLALADDERVVRVLAAEEDPVEALYGNRRTSVDYADEAGQVDSGSPDSPAPDDPEPEPEPSPDPEDPELVELAAATIVSDGAYKGKTLGHIADKGDSKWLKWLCKEETHDLVLQGRTLTKARFPDVYEQAMAELEDA